MPTGATTESLGRALPDGPLPLLAWRPSTEATALRPDEIQLWRIRTDDQGMSLAQAATLLGPAQRDRAQALRYPHHRERYLRAQAGLRLILARQLGSPPETIEFRRGPAGKPYLAAPCRPLGFNLTTSGDLALVALSLLTTEAPEIGVDCERIAPRAELLAIARRLFTPAAVAELEASPEAQRLEGFYRCWTALEADAKTDGRGLFRPRPVQARPPQIGHCIPAAGYIAAIARASLPPVSAWQVFDLAGLETADTPD